MELLLGVRTVICVSLGMKIGHFTVAMFTLVNDKSAGFTERFCLVIKR